MCRTRSSFVPAASRVPFQSPSGFTCTICSWVAAKAIEISKLASIKQTLVTVVKFFIFDFLSETAPCKLYEFAMLFVPNKTKRPDLAYPASQFSSRARFRGNDSASIVVRNSPSRPLFNSFSRELLSQGRRDDNIKSVLYSAIAFLLFRGDVLGALLGKRQDLFADLLAFGESFFNVLRSILRGELLKLGR